MPQNTSSAVMQQRHEADGSLDDFPSPPWAVRALFEHVLIPALGDRRMVERLLAKQFAHEPACGRGHLKRALLEYFGECAGSDVHDYGHGAAERIGDYLDPAFETLADWTITNPPFKCAEQFILKALEQSSFGVAMLVRSAFLEGTGRHRRLFQPHPPTIVAQFTERVPMHRGRLLRKGSTATAYSWVVWLKDWDPRPFLFIPPCRKQLEMDADYFWSED